MPSDTLSGQYPIRLILLRDEKVLCFFCSLPQNVPLFSAGCSLGLRKCYLTSALCCWMESFFHSSFNRFVLIDRKYWYKYIFFTRNHCWHWWCVLTSLTFLQVMFITTARVFTSQTKPEGLASLLPNRKRDRRLGELSLLAWNYTNVLRNFWRITWQIFLR